VIFFFSRTTIIITLKRVKLNKKLYTYIVVARKVENNKKNKRYKKQ